MERVLKGAQATTGFGVFMFASGGSASSESLLMPLLQRLLPLLQRLLLLVRLLFFYLSPAWLWSSLLTMMMFLASLGLSRLSLLFFN